MHEKAKPQLLVSIISHNKGHELKHLLDCIEKYCSKKIVVIITLNVEEKLPFSESDYSFLLITIKNQTPKGFGANHNQAFAYMESEYFCVLNTDIYFFEDPFSALIENTDQTDLGVMAPLVYCSNNQLQDSARKLPTPLQLFKRRFNTRADYVPSGSTHHVDWVAGFFMLFTSDSFRKLQGFNEKYYLYCEDVDICSRLWLQGKKVLWNSGVVIYHDAQRSSHREWRFLGLHLASLLRLFCSSVYYRRYYQKTFLQG